MRIKNFLLAIFAAGLALQFLSSGSDVANAQLYLETFDTAAAGGPVTNYGWQADIATGGIGTFDDTAFGGGDGNVAWVFGNAGDTNALYSNEPININPAAFTNGVKLSVDVDPAFNSSAASPLSYWAVKIGGSNWYSSVAPIGVGAATESWKTFKFEFNPAAANWNQLTLTNGAGAPTIGAPAAGNLIGNITGVGVVVNHIAAGTHHYDNFAVLVGALDGDVDGDDDVDMIDFGIIRSNMSNSVTLRSQGDLNGDGVVDLLDFSEWKDNFPSPLSGLVTSGVNVPEPSSLLMSGLGLIVCLGARRFSQS